MPALMRVAFADYFAQVAVLELDPFVGGVQARLLFYSRL